MRPVVAFDLDGTLYDWAPGAKKDYDDPKAIVDHTLADPRAMGAVRRFFLQGFEMHVVTGRTEPVRLATSAKLSLEFPHIHHRRVHMQPEWKGWDALRRFKADTLASIGHGLYIGDHRIDKEAAAMAGWVFTSAQDWLSSPSFPTKEAW